MPTLWLVLEPFKLRLALLWSFLEECSIASDYFAMNVEFIGLPRTFPFLLVEREN